MGHFMAYGISLISSYFIIEVTKKYSLIKKSTSIIILISLFSFHGFIKYSISSGLKHYELGNYNTSIRHLERVVDFYPKKIGKFHSLLSEMYLTNNNLEEAFKHANNAKTI